MDLGKQPLSKLLWTYTLITRWMKLVLWAKILILKTHTLKKIGWQFFQMIKPLGIGVFGNMQNFCTKYMANKSMKLT